MLSNAALGHLLWGGERGTSGIPGPPSPTCEMEGRHGMLCLDFSAFKSHVFKEESYAVPGRK